jgi:hypothetical protein
MSDFSLCQSKNENYSFCFSNSFSYDYFSTVEVLVTLTGDVGRVMSKMHLVQPKGQVNLVTGIRIAHVNIVSSKLPTKLHLKSILSACVEASSRKKS